MQHDSRLDRRSSSIWKSHGARMMPVTTSQLAPDICGQPESLARALNHRHARCAGKALK
jgi:hypothetical protein